MDINFSVPQQSITYMTISAIASVVIPIILFIIFRKKYKADIKPFFIGCAVFILFALVLEQIFHSIILTSSIGNTIQNNIWVLAIYGGLMAGLFEETGRYLAFISVLKKNNGKDENSLMYGAGHCGIEILFILGLSMVSNIVISVMINNQTTSALFATAADEIQRQTLITTLETLANTPSVHFLMALVERIATIGVHISLSVLVWFAAKKGGKQAWLYPLAILFHTLINAVAIVLSKYTTNLWLVEAAIYIMTACFIFVAVKVWKKNYSILNSTVYESEVAD